MEARELGLIGAFGVAFVLGMLVWIWWRRKTVYRRELPRIYELRDLLPNPPPPGAYLRNLDELLAEIPQKLRQFRHLERDLQGLDTAAWNFLKSELEPLLTAQDAKRGWQPVWDRLNQAKAYNHLKDAGYHSIEFVPPSTVGGLRTPDLRAELNTTSALCEVKTINISEIEAERRHSSGVGSTSNRLEFWFFQAIAIRRRASQKADGGLRSKPGNEKARLYYRQIR